MLINVFILWYILVVRNDRKLNRLCVDLWLCGFVFANPEQIMRCDPEGEATNRGDHKNVSGE